MQPSNPNDLASLIMEVLPETEQHDPHKEVFDFSSPESVLIEVICLLEPGDEGDRTLWKNHSIESCTVIACAEDVTGAAQYDSSYGAGIDYTITQCTECPGEGWFVVEGITANYHRGDGWTTDDDMDFNMSEPRPATPDEILLA
jgi:hypothetical protein